MRPTRIGAAFAAAFICASTGLAQNDQQPGNESAPSGGSSVGRHAGRIASQPARDVGAVRREIPPVLEQAAAHPYGLNGTASCAQLASGISALSGALGADYTSPRLYRENRAGKLAAAGGKTVINSLIPFRGLVREISGAAPAERRLDAAINAGIARRGFLRGLQQARRCRVR